MSNSVPASRDAAAEVGVNRREIPTSAYDFLNGAYKATQRAVLAASGLALLLVLVIALLVARGVGASVEASSLQARQKSLDVDHQKALDQFGTLTGVEGVSERDLLARDKDLSAGIADALKGVPDIAAVLAYVQQSAASAGVSVTRFDIKPLVPDKGAPAPSPDPDSPDQDVQRPDRLYTVVVAGSSEDFARAITWGEDVRASGLLSNLQVSAPGSGAVTLSGVLAAVNPPLATRDLMSTLSITVDPGVPPPPPTPPGENGAATPGSAAALPVSPAPASPAPASSGATP